LAAAAGFAAEGFDAAEDVVEADFDAPVEGFAAGGVDAELVDEGFAADGFATVAGFAADGFAAVAGFGADGFAAAAAGLRAPVPAARPVLPDAARAVRVVPGVAPPVLAPPARVPAAGGGAVTSASFSSRCRRLPIPAPAPTTLRPCSIAVSRIFFGVSGMR
jgi:hypothetical protein